MLVTPARASSLGPVRSPSSRHRRAPRLSHLQSASAIVEEASDICLAAFRELARTHKLYLHVGSLAIKVSPDKAANRLALAETQLTWLREIGFVEVDCYWKLFELAVLAGFRAS